MDAVNAFNMELFSMIDMKPPISRAKMMSVTKSAIKAIKLYKHVVQIVEKFIKKCKPELKVPGLYVVDSIVRQSRHQFGVDKDVFGPRFLKNFTETFQNLYHCPEDDKSKIVRVLNLWQKNGVFDMDILQPLMDMEDVVISPPPALEVPVDFQPETAPPVNNATNTPTVPQLPSSDALAAVAQLLQSPHCQELQMMLQSFQQAEKTLTVTAATDNISNPIPVNQFDLYAAETVKKASLAEKLLDRFEYDDDPEDILVSDGKIQTQVYPVNKLNQFPGQMFNTDINSDLMGQTGDMKHIRGMSHGEHHMTAEGCSPIGEGYSQSQDNSRENSSRRSESIRRSYGMRSRSGSRSPRRRRRSRSSSRSRWSRQQRSRSREQRWRSRSGSRDRSEREKDRERRQRGLPVLKSQTLSVCSTTLWVGQLDKKTQQSDVMSLLEEFGQIESINMIPPRGCAYIVMVHRQDAYTALRKLSRGSYKVNQKPVKIAWALNRGIKPAHKKFWDVEQGVTYIPWGKVKVDELETFKEGGILDPETLNPEWNIARDYNNQAAVNGPTEMVPDVTVAAHVQMPVIQKAGSIGSPPPFPGPVMLSPSSLPPGGAPFMPAEFTPANFALAPDESKINSKGNKDAIGTCNQLVPPQTMAMPNSAVMQGPPRQAMPLQPRPTMPNSHMPRFPSHPNMQHIPPQMMPGGPVYPGRFRMSMPFPPHGPPAQQYPPMGHEMEHFRTMRPGFTYPPFQRGRW
uniref:SR-related CTD-associated factor 4b n=1 Tax=Nothobranchius pienaari TaxID=704102 RepID=A0A1A8NQ05_9TELE